VTGLINKHSKLTGIVNHTLTESTIILSSIKSSVDDDSFIGECFTVRFVCDKRDSFDPVFSNKVHWCSTGVADHLSSLGEDGKEGDQDGAISIRSHMHKSNV
jgi:hypothetical protein